MKITVKLLEKMKACKSEIEKFKNVFPNGVTISLSNIRKALKADLEMEWFSVEMVGDKDPIFQDQSKCEKAKGRCYCCHDYFDPPPEGCPWDVESCAECDAIDLWNLYVDGKWRLPK